ncbi:NAD(P)H-binding protein [Streptomyces sp. NPDC046977]|uniref:NAD(P)-dependent oxidoreductase n=1 Tax=Streptomyces sp. NPDC046977 TaxID=3154703 RepID=UPI003402076E
MNITVFGATGRTGRALLEAAHHRGHRTTAHARDATRLSGTLTDLVVTGSVLDPATADDAVREADAVVIAFGLRGNPATPLYTDGTRTIIEAMHKRNVPRLVVISEAAYPPHLRGATARVIAAAYRAFNARAIRQRREQDAIVEASRLDWTFLRPTRLVPGDTPVVRPARASFTPYLTPVRSASYAGMAALVLDTLNSPPTYRRSLYL